MIACRRIKKNACAKELARNNFRGNSCLKGRALVVLGAQFGDEGKGKFVDVLSEKADLVCRVQGGNNAGHTIYVGAEKIVTHLLPIGVVRESCEVAIGAGVVIDPVVLQGECQMIMSKGIARPTARAHRWTSPRHFRRITNCKTASAKWNVPNRVLRSAQRGVALVRHTQVAHIAMACACANLSMEKLLEKHTRRTTSPHRRPR